MPPTIPSHKCGTRPYSCIIYFSDCVVLSPSLPKSLPSVIVFNRSKSLCILNIFSAISHCKFSLDSLIIFGEYAAYFGIVFNWFCIILEKLLENLERLHFISTTHFNLTGYI